MTRSSGKRHWGEFHDSGQPNLSPWTTGIRSCRANRPLLRPGAGISMSTRAVATAEGVLRRASSVGAVFQTWGKAWEEGSARGPASRRLVRGFVEPIEPERMAQSTSTSSR